MCTTCWWRVIHSFRQVCRLGSDIADILGGAETKGPLCSQIFLQNLAWIWTSHHLRFKLLSQHLLPRLFLLVASSPKIGGVGVTLSHYDLSVGWGGTPAQSLRDTGLGERCWEKGGKWRNEGWELPKANALTLPLGSREWCIESTSYGSYHSLFHYAWRSESSEGWEVGALKGGSCYTGHVGLRPQALGGREKYFSRVAFGLSLRQTWNAWWVGYQVKHGTPCPPGLQREWQVIFFSLSISHTLHGA